jgi:FkbM family methyltransferase
MGPQQPGSSPAIGVRDRLLNAVTQAARRLPKGRTTVHRLVWTILGRPDRYFGRIDGQWFRVDPADRNIAVTTIVHDRWEPAAAALWVHLLRPGMHVVDIGANKGYFSLLAAPRIGSTGRLISYEPLPGNADDAQATAIVNRHDHWLVRQVAVSSRAGTAAFHIPIGADGSGWGSLESTSGKPVLDITVPLVTLDADLEELGMDRVDLAKLDIQGHELEALRGASTYLQTRRIRALIIEVHQHILGDARVAELFDLLVQAGYRARVLVEDALSAPQWRAVLRGEVPFDPAKYLSPVDAATDERLHTGGWCKLLWEC